MKYWQISSNEVTNFTTIACEETPDIREITKVEYDHYKEWLKKYGKK